MQKGRSVWAKLLFLILSIGIFSASVTAYLGYKNARESLKKQALAHLVSVRDIKHNHIEAYFKEKLFDTQILAQDTVFIEFAEKYVGNPVDIESYGKKSGHGGELLADIEQEAASTANYMSFHDIFIIDVDGNILYTHAKEDDFGTNLIQGKYKDSPLAKVFSKGLTKPSTVDIAFYEASHEISTFFASPMLDEKGNTIGVLATQITMTEIDRIMQERSGLGETGETLLVGPDLLLRSDSRFHDERTVLKLKVDREAPRQAIAGKSGTMWSLDYRNVPVLNAYTPIRVLDLNWGLVVKIDEAEVLAPVYRLRRHLLTSAIGFLVLILLVSYFSARMFTRPILELDMKLKAMTETGTYGETIPISSRDEVGSLVESFNKMSSAINLQTNALVKELIEHSKTEKALAEAQKLARIGSWEWDIATGSNIWSDEIWLLFGLKPGSVTPSFKNFLDFIHPDDRERAEKANQDAIKTNKAYDIEFRIIRRDGVELIIHSQGKVKTDDTGKRVGMVGTAQDITERKKAEEELDNVFNLSPDMIWAGTLDGTLTKVNLASKKTLGYATNELIGKSFLHLLHPEDVEPTKNELSKALAGDKEHYIENRYRCKNGKYKWIGWTALSDKDAGIFYASGRDITERKKAEDAIRESEKKYRKLIETASDAIFIANAETGIIIGANKKAETLLGLPVDEIIGMHQSQLHPKEESENYRKMFEGHVLTGNEAPEILFVENKDGRHIPVEISSSVMEFGGVQIVQGIFRDMTEHLKSEKELRESEAKMRAVLNTTSHAIITLDSDRVIQSMNPAAEKLFGYSELFLVGGNISILIPEQLKKQHREGFERYLRTGEKKIMGEWVEVPCLRSDGSTFPAELNVTEWQIGDSKMFTGILRDISEKKRMEKSLIEAKEAAEFASKELKQTLIISDDLRDEAMVAREDSEAFAEEADRANRYKSEFLSNMSHELRTPMHGILSFSEMGLEEASEGDTSELTHYFTRIQESGKRLLALLNDLLDLSKLEAGKIDYKMEQNDLRKVVESSTSELHSIIKSRSLNIEIETTDLETSAWFDREKIHQVVCNILSNAIKFSFDKDTIRFSFDSETLPQDGHEDIPALSLKIEDRGFGIPEDELESIFDKFVQSKKTKSGAGGTGLGLAITKEIVSAHGGHIKAGNNPNGGAFFRFTLPKKDPANV